MNRVDGDLHVGGTLTASLNVPSPGSVVNATVLAGAGIAATKLQQQRNVSWSQDATTDAYPEMQKLLTVNGATGTVESFQAASVSIAAGSGNAVIDLMRVRAGATTSILSSAITLDSTNVAHTPEEASGFSATALVAGDQLWVKVTSVTSPTLPKGLSCDLVITEDAQ